jgi:hypothetical protein
MAPATPLSGDGSRTERAREPLTPGGRFMGHLQAKYDRRAMDDPTSPPSDSFRPAAAPPMRASDAERERTTEVLSRAAATGQIDVEELDERLQAAWAARTRADLERLVADVDVEVDAGETALARAGTSNRVKVVGHEGSRWIVSIMGGNERRGRWRIASRCTVLNIMGGSNLDLCDVELSGQVTELNFFSLMGGGEIRVPDDVRVDISKFALMGGHEVRLGDAAPPPTSPLIRIRLLSIMGGAQVRRGRKGASRDHGSAGAARRTELEP